MRSWAIVFLALALAAAVDGFDGTALATAGAARMLSAMFFVLFLVSLRLARRRGGPLA